MHPGTGRGQPHDEPGTVFTLAIVEQFVLVSLARLHAVGEHIFHLGKSAEMHLELGIAPPGHVAHLAAREPQIGTPHGEPFALVGDPAMDAAE